jgi:hypothetical protein
VPDALPIHRLLKPDNLISLALFTKAEDQADRKNSLTYPKFLTAEHSLIENVDAIAVPPCQNCYTVCTSLTSSHTKGIK